MQHSHLFDRLLTGSSPAAPNLAPVVPGVELRRSECGERAADRSQVVPHERVGTTAALRGCLAFGLAACSKEPAGANTGGGGSCPDRNTGHRHWQMSWASRNGNVNEWRSYESCAH